MPAEVGAIDAGLLDALGSALIVSDVSGTILLWNAAAERLYGYSREEMLGASVMALFVMPEDKGQAEQIMAQVLAGGSWTGEFPVRCADGTTKVVRVTDSPLIRDGELVGIVGLGEEVDDAPDGETPSAKALADLEAALAELEGLKVAMRTRATIEQAKGILMATCRVDAEGAFDMLRSLSQNQNRKLVDVAAEIVAGATDLVL